jgi:ankyrin repeat protein
MLLVGRMFFGTPISARQMVGAALPIAVAEWTFTDLALLENDRYDAVAIAAVANDDATLRVLLALGASAKLTTSRYDGTASIAAAHLGHVNNLHWTAVIESIVLGDGGTRHQQVLQALLSAGASTRLTDREGNTPLTLAKSRGYGAMVSMLEKASAR